jgi:hypothetical protein
MQMREKSARLLLKDILVVTKLPPWADAAWAYALGLAHEHRARLHVAHATAPHLFESQKHTPSDGRSQSPRDAMQAVCQLRRAISI